MPGEETTTVVTHPDGTTITTTTSAPAATGDRSYLDTVGATPMVRVERALPEEAKQARVLVKLEMQVRLFSSLLAARWALTLLLLRRTLAAPSRIASRSP